MDQLSAKELARITALEVAAMTAADKAFLRARRYELTDAQKEQFAEVLTGTEEAIEPKAKTKTKEK